MDSLATSSGKSVEAELGRLSGSEGGITVTQREAHLTDPIQAKNNNLELIERMQVEIDAMKKPVKSKITLFGSNGKAKRVE